MSNKGVTLPKPKKQSRKAKKSQGKSSLMQRGIGAFFGALALIGGAVAFLTLLPRISVTPSDPVDPDNALSASFTISNNNFIPLRHVSASLGIGEIQPVGKPLDPNVAYSEQGSLMPDSWTNHSVDMDERFTITPFDVVHAYGDRQASIQIIVSYQPWILPLERQKRFRFETHRQTNGKLYWYALPSS